MGEYAKLNGEIIKIGTCESMYYLRYEDRLKVTPSPCSLNPRIEKNLFWRLPFADEDGVEVGNYTHHNRGLRLSRRVDDCRASINYSIQTDKAGSFQISHESGLLLSVPCYHGEKLPDQPEGWRVGWNGKSWAIELAFLKNTEEGVLPIVRCRFCGDMWRCTWDEIWEYIPEDMQKRLEVYKQEATQETLQVTT